MIEFNDSFSQAAMAEALCAHPGLTKLITHQLMLPSFAYAHDVEGRRIGGPLVQPNPVLHKTMLYVSPREMREHLPREISFVRLRCPCNAAGQPVGEWQRVIVALTSTTAAMRPRIGVAIPDQAPKSNNHHFL